MAERTVVKRRIEEKGKKGCVWYHPRKSEGKNGKRKKADTGK